MPILRYQQVTKQFSPDSYGLQNVTFSIEPGEMVVITGHTGSGKTTLMKVLTCEYTITEGELYFNQTPVHKLKSNKVHLHRRQIGVVYQDYRLIKEMTAWENIALPLYIAGKKEEEIEQRVSDLLMLVKLADKYDHFPTQLSGGEAQRISIARSLALAPELIFADEPTGNLDADATKQIALLLSKINELGTTVLLSTHDTSLLETFDNERHIQLEKGAVVADSGSHKKTKEHETVATSMGVPIKLEQTDKTEPAEEPKKITISEPEPAATSETKTQPDTKQTIKIENAAKEAEPAAPETKAGSQSKRRFWHKLSLGNQAKKSSKKKKETA
jgi:cell division transport system ATP-binding protein